MPADDPAEVEAVVEGADELSHPIHAGEIPAAPTAESPFRGVTDRKAGHDRVGRQRPLLSARRMPEE